MLTMLLNVLPSSFLLARDGASCDPQGISISSSDVIAEIHKDFGIGSYKPDPFKELHDELKIGIIRDPLAGLTVDTFFGTRTPAFSLDQDLHDEALFDGWYDSLEGSADNDDEVPQTRKKRLPNLYPYQLGDVYQSNWYRKYLHEDVRHKTYVLSSRDRFGEFRCHFRMPLFKVDDLVDMFLDKGWIHKTKHCNNDDRLKLKAQLLILGTLNILGHNKPFRALHESTEISTEEHRVFFHVFLDKMYSIQQDFIHYPDTREELSKVMKRYATKNLPGAGGSVDIVHLKWSHCPAGDYNRCKGKEAYPTVAFQVISGFDREILGVSSVQFGTRNDKHIVKLDKNVANIRDKWYKTVKWDFYDSNGQIHTAVGVYLICDGGYLRWPILICPYKSAHKASLEGYFSTNLESIRKDVEYVFGILKKRWRCLESGLCFRDIRVIEKVFVVCCMLHNMMLSEMETRESTYRVGRGTPNTGDAIWLRGPGPTSAPTSGDRCNRRLAAEWGKRRRDLATHLEYAKRKKKRARTITP